MRKCKKCEKEVPWTVEIGGKKRSLKNRIFCLECSPFKEHNTRDLSKVNLKSKDQIIDKNTLIRYCKHHGKVEFCIESNGRFRCKKCRCEAVIKCRKKKMQNKKVEIDLQQLISYINAMPSYWSIGICWIFICLFVGTPVMRNKIRNDKRLNKYNWNQDSIAPLENIICWAITPIWLPFWLLWMLISWKTD